MLTHLDTESLWEDMSETETKPQKEIMSETGRLQCHLNRKLTHSHVYLCLVVFRKLGVNHKKTPVFFK